MDIEVKIYDRVKTGVFPQWMKDPRASVKEFALPANTWFEVDNINSDGTFDVVNLDNNEIVNNCTPDNFKELKRASN